MHHMRKHVTLHKKLGETPLQAIQKWKEAHSAYKDVPASYAGRLDPMAEGTLLVLLGEECKKQAKYRGLDKEYVVEIVLDLHTDTGDVLGMPSYTGIETAPSDDAIYSVVRNECGTHEVPYPAFSSKTVNGKPLFLYALEGTLDSIEIPTHGETIHRISLEKSVFIPKEDIATRIRETLAMAPRTLEPSKELGADFRQDEIRAHWDGVFSAMPERVFQVYTLRVVCGSGTYMRSLAERMGTALGTEALALSIRRTRIGTYVPFLGLWIRTY